MKKLLPLVFLFAFVSVNYGQNAIKNEEYCKSVIATKNVYRVNAIFKISPLDSSNQIALTDFLYTNKHSIYKIEFGVNNTINIFHIDDVKVDFLKELLIQFNCYVDLVGVIIQKQEQ